MALILASGSPRRRELIALVDPRVKIVPAHVSEEGGSYLTPAEHALTMASRKARHVSRRYSDFVLGADTIVCLGPRIFGKPSHREENKAMLRELAGRWHEVITGIALWKEDVMIAEDVVLTKVLFTPMTETEIVSYVNTDEGLDKAGGYGIQGLAAKYIARIEGCYYNVVGLPVAAVAKLLKAIE